jgi:hypothetical protein
LSHEQRAVVEHVLRARHAHQLGQRLRQKERAQPFKPEARATRTNQNQAPFPKEARRACARSRWKVDCAREISVRASAQHCHATHHPRQCARAARRFVRHRHSPPPPAASRLGGDCARGCQSRGGVATRAAAKLAAPPLWCAHATARRKSAKAGGMAPTAHSTWPNEIQTAQQQQEERVTAENLEFACEGGGGGRVGKVL